MVVRCFWIALAALALACDGKEKEVVPDDPGNGGDPGIDPSESVTPAPYTGLTWTVADVDVGTALAAAGYQGKLLRGDDGTLYYGFMKATGGRELTCDIAAFGGDAAPGVNYELRVAVLPAGGTAWAVEVVPLAEVDPDVPYLTNRYGLDGTIDAQGQPVFVFAGGAGSGGGSVALCGSGDLVVATRSAAGAWSFQRPVTTSGSCCSWCSEPACTSGTDVGPWAAAAVDGAGGLAVSFMDYHYNWDQDGMVHRGLELWNGSVRGIRPWSGLGTYGALRYVPADGGATLSGLVAAYTSVVAAGVYVARQVGTAGALTDWEQTTVRAGVQIGERLSLAVAPDGTVGLAFYQMKNAAGNSVDDLVYCAHAPAATQWSCQSVDTLNSVGAYPSLAFDSQSRPALSYYYCGAAGNCTPAGDGLRYAWRDPARNRWARFSVHFDGGRKTGLYTQLVIDPATDEPTIVFHDATRGAAMAARGQLSRGAP